MRAGLVARSSCTAAGWALRCARAFAEASGLARASGGVERHQSCCLPHLPPWSVGPPEVAAWRAHVVWRGGRNPGPRTRLVAERFLEAAGPL
ncbi:hypothetical protein NDU88_007506 [Pleurodeles waltl]|uniref:LysR family transcriptional regulator n=1 Tax=Pleurodeles waltl TaxID=8319 RepID=A0AAV7VSS7_PLEWA|nr:hypothetical protein NDU88_007506 [Pleurodeles waltl]